MLEAIVDLKVLVKKDRWELGLVAPFVLLTSCLVLR